jgi:hypothetical protein
MAASVLLSFEHFVLDEKDQCSLLKVAVYLVLFLA